jgi:hypothetical protein
VLASALALIPRDIRTIRNSDTGIRDAGIRYNDAEPSLSDDEAASVLETHQPPVPYLPG